MICLLLSAFLAVGCCITASAASESCISEISLEVGADSRTQLEDKGYSVLFQGMNLSSENDSTVTLGYKKGADAITALIISTEYAASLTYNSCSFRPVSSVSLNAGTSGKPLYLYYTKDSKAGSGITRLDTVSGFTDRDDVVPLRNDGSSPVLMNDGTLANLDSGIDNSELYLLVYRVGKIRRYISNACIVKSSTKAQAINSAASKGCDFYLDCDISDSDSEVCYIAYKRTADKADAITKITVSGENLSFEKNKQANAYLIDISDYKPFDQSFKLGDWAGLYAASDKSVSKTSDEYKALAASTESCSCVSAGKSEIYASYEGTADASAEQAQKTVVTTTASSNNAMDEFYNIEKTEAVETPTDGGSSDSSTASAISGGSIAAMVCLLAGIALIAACVIVLKKRQLKKKHEKPNEKDNKEK